MCILWTLILLSRRVNWVRNRGFVNKSAIWCYEATCIVFNVPFWIFSHIKWQSISMCLVLLWKNLISCNVKAASLSQNNITGLSWFTPRSLRRESSHTTSQVALAIEWSLAWANDLEIVCCFLDFQEMNESPRKHTITTYWFSTMRTSTPVSIYKSL